MAEFSVSDTGEPLILTCLKKVLPCNGLPANINESKLNILKQWSACKGVYSTTVFQQRV